MIDSIVDYGVSIGIVIISFAIIIFLYLNNKKPKKQAPPQTKKPPKHLHFKSPSWLKKIINFFKGSKELYETVKWIVAIVLFFCGAQANATIEDVYTDQKTICEDISKVNNNVKKSEERLNKCMQDNAATINNKLDKLDSLLATKDPNNIK